MGIDKIGRGLGFPISNNMFRMGRMGRMVRVGKVMAINMMVMFLKTSSSSCNMFHRLLPHREIWLPIFLNLRSSGIRRHRIRILGLVRGM